MTPSTVNVDWQALFNIAMAVAGGAIGWTLGRLTRTLDMLDRDVRALPEKYVSKEDYRSDLGDIKALLVRIETKLDGKVDK